MAVKLQKRKKLSKLKSIYIDLCNNDKYNETSPNNNSLIEINGKKVNKYDFDSDSNSINNKNSQNSGNKAQNTDIKV